MFLIFNIYVSFIFIFIFTLTFSFDISNSKQCLNSNAFNNNIYNNENIKYISSSILINNCLSKEKFKCIVKISRNLNISCIETKKEVLYKSNHLRGSKNQIEFIPTSNIDELSLLIRFILLNLMIFIFINYYSEVSFKNYFKTTSTSTPLKPKKYVNKQVTPQQYLSNDVIIDIKNKKRELIKINLSKKILYLIKFRRLQKAKNLIVNNEKFQKEIKNDNDKYINNTTCDALTTNDID